MTKALCFLSLALFVLAAPWASAGDTAPPAGEIAVYSGRPLSSYQALFIGDFTTAGATVSNVPPDAPDEAAAFEQIRREMVTAVADELLSRLKSGGTAVKVGKLTAGSQRTAGAAIVEGRFTAIDAGRRGLRMFIGFSGTASATIAARVVDAATGREIASYTKTISAPLGWAGSERVLLQITRELADGLAAFLLKHS